MLVMKYLQNKNSPKPPLVSIEYISMGDKKYKFIAKVETTKEKIENYSWQIKRLDIKNTDKEKELLYDSLMNKNNRPLAKKIRLEHIDDCNDEIDPLPKT